MSYDLEKYRDKREKVLGVKTRGMSFGTLAVIVSGFILFGLSSFIIPRSIAYFSERHLDDAIFRLQDAGEWPQTILTEIVTLKGVKNATTDKDGYRLVVTFDKMSTEVTDFETFFKSRGLDFVMLNRVSHHQRKTTMEEEEKFEAL